MAVVNIGQWIPEDWAASKVVMQYINTSAIQRIATSPGGRLEIMNTDLKHIPKDGGADVQFTARGAAYGLDTKATAQLLLNASKLTYLGSFNEEDVDDAKTFVNTLEAKQMSAASNLALLLDNAVFGVTGAATAEPTMDRPYTSVFQNALVSNATGQVTSISRAGSLDSQRSGINNALSYAEQTQFASDDLVVVASPAYKPIMRNAPANGFVGVPMYDPANETVFGYPVFWTRGAVNTAVATNAPGNANPLLFIVPREQLILGRRWAFEWMYIDPRTGIGAISDTAYLKARQRSAFQLGDQSAPAVVQLTA